MAYDPNDPPPVNTMSPEYAAWVQRQKAKVSSGDQSKAQKTMDEAKNAFGYSQPVFNTAGNIGGEGQRQQRFLGNAAGSAEQGMLLRGLQGLANGTGPSAAGRMLTAQSNQNILQQQALANSGGGNAALNAALAARSAASARGSLANQLGNARVQEQLGAYGQLGAAVANQQQNTNQNLQMEMQQALANATNDLDRERIRASYIQAMYGNQPAPEKSWYEKALSAGAQALGVIAPAGLYNPNKPKAPGA